MDHLLRARVEEKIGPAETRNQPVHSEFWSSRIDFDSHRTLVLMDGTWADNAGPGPKLLENESIVVLRRLNDISDLNDFLREAHERLMVGAHLAVRLRPLTSRRRDYAMKHSKPVFALRYGFDCVVHRVLARIGPTRYLHRLLFGTKARVISETEALGRLAFCGFELIERQEINGDLHIICRKTGAAPREGDPAYGLFFSLQRLGQNGKLIRVYKLRTMHPYAEYIQTLVHAADHLSDRGKPKNDFRVTTWGRWLRRTWIDELPMLINFVRGELKLVGVRPISPRYSEMLPPDFLAYRLRFKPGLIPPFYADLPKTFAEIVASERRYLRRFVQAPLYTDLRYLFRAFMNIAKGARSE